MPIDLISNLLVSGETRFFADEIDSQDISFGEYRAFAHIFTYSGACFHGYAND